MRNAWLICLTVVFGMTGAHPPDALALLPPEFYPMRVTAFSFSKNPGVYAVVTNHGVLLTRDDAVTWSLYCSRLLGWPTPNEFEATSTVQIHATFGHGGALFMGGFDGTEARWARGQMQECSWPRLSSIDSAQQLMTHMFSSNRLFAVRPKAPDATEILISKDDGDTFELFGTLPEKMGRLHSGDAPHGASSTYFEASSKPFGLWTSIAGSMYSRQQGGIGGATDDVRVLTSLGSRLYFQVKPSGSNRPVEIWRSLHLDGGPGKIMTLVLGENVIGLAATFEKIWIAIRGADDKPRLIFSPDDGKTFQALPKGFGAQNLMVSQGKLLASGVLDGVDGAWISRDDGVSWQALFRAKDISTPACQGDLCAASLSYITGKPAQPGLGTSVRTDGGSPTAIDTARPVDAAAKESDVGLGPQREPGDAQADPVFASSSLSRGGGCGCRVGGNRRSSLSALVLLMAAAFATRLRLRLRAKVRSR